MKNFLKRSRMLIPFLLGLAINRIANAIGIDIFSWQIVFTVIIVFIIYVLIINAIDNNKKL